MMNKKMLCVSLCSILLAGCSLPEDIILACASKETSTASQTIVKEPIEDDSESGNVITYSDKEGMLDVINADLESRYGTGRQIYTTIKTTDFSKQGNIYIAKAHYNVNGEKDEEYAFVREDSNKGIFTRTDMPEEHADPTPAPQIQTAKPEAAEDSFTPSSTYPFSCSSSLSVTASYDGSGTLHIAVAKDGKIVKSIFNDKGPLNTTKSVDLEAGSYEIWLAVEGDGYASFSYNAN